MTTKSKGAGTPPTSAGGAPPRAADDESNEKEKCPECGATIGDDGKCPECGWEQGEERADEGKAKGAKAPEAPAAGSDLEKVRAEAAAAERKRIADIRKLGANADAALVEACINEGISADAAARRFLEASNAKLQGKLDALKGDESKTKAPSTTSAASHESDPDRAAAQEILAVHQKVNPSRSR